VRYTKLKQVLAVPTGTPLEERDSRAKPRMTLQPLLKPGFRTKEHAAIGFAYVTDLPAA
jgi:hypothetical protein